MQFFRSQYSCIAVQQYKTTECENGLIAFLFSVVLLVLTCPASLRLKHSTDRRRLTDFLVQGQTESRYPHSLVLLFAIHIVLRIHRSLSPVLNSHIRIIRLCSSPSATAIEIPSWLHFFERLFVLFSPSPIMDQFEIQRSKSALHLQSDILLNSLSPVVSTFENVDTLLKQTPIAEMEALSPPPTPRQNNFPAPLPPNRKHHVDHYSSSSVQIASGMPSVDPPSWFPTSPTTKDGSNLRNLRNPMPMRERARGLQSKKICSSLDNSAEFSIMDSGWTEALSERHKVRQRYNTQMGDILHRSYSCESPSGSTGTAEHEPLAQASSSSF